MGNTNQFTEKYGRLAIPLVPLLLLPEVAYAYSPPFPLIAAMLGGPILFIVLSFVVALSSKFKGKRFIAWLGVVIPMGLGVLFAYLHGGGISLSLVIFFPLLVLVGPFVALSIISHGPNE